MADSDPSLPHAAPRRSIWPRVLGFGAAGVALLLAGFVAGFTVARGRPTRPTAAAAALPDLGPAPHYTLQNQLGQTVSSTRFDGKVRIVTFLFPYCTTYCPLITVHLIGFEHLLQQMGHQNHVEVVAFNVAPEAADQSAMREYLKQYVGSGGSGLAVPDGDAGGDPAGGHRRLSRRLPEGRRHGHRRWRRDELDQTPQVAVANPLAARVKPDFDIAHNDALVIVDTHGRIRKIYDDADVVSAEQLWNDIAPLLKR